MVRLSQHSDVGVEQRGAVAGARHVQPAWRRAPVSAACTRASVIHDALVECAR